LATTVPEDLDCIDELTLSEQPGIVAELAGYACPLRDGACRGQRDGHATVGGETVFFLTAKDVVRLRVLLAKLP
jgi:hypothetical protein